MRRSGLLAVASLLSASAAAQTTWVVDAAGGQGSHFVYIQAGVNAAADGDTILVRAGAYPEALRIEKGVYVAADDGVVVTSLAPESLRIANVALGRTLTIRGLSFGLLGRILVSDCAGGVHLQRLSLPSTTTSNLFTISNCAQVTLTAVTTYGLPALTVTASRAVLIDCRVQATSWVTTWPGMVVDAADVTIVGGGITGGSSSLAPPSPAIHLVSGRLALAGANTVIAAGTDFTGSRVSAVQTQAGRVDVEPAVSLVSRNGAPAIGGPATVVGRRIPSVRATGLASRGAWSLELHAPASSPFCLFASLPQATQATPWGELWLDLGNHVVLACGTVGAGDRFTLVLPLPSLPRGVALAAQGAVALAVAVELTTVAVDIVH